MKALRVVDGSLPSLWSTFTDPGFDNPLATPATTETFTYEIDWGDGTSHDTGTATIDTSGGEGQLTEGSFNGTHTYSDADDYTVTVTISDDDDGEDSWYLQVTAAPDVEATGFEVERGEVWGQSALSH